METATKRKLTKDKFKKEKYKQFSIFGAAVSHVLK